MKQQTQYLSVWKKKKKSHYAPILCSRYFCEWQKESVKKEYIIVQEIDIPLQIHKNVHKFYICELFVISVGVFRKGYFLLKRHWLSCVTLLYYNVHTYLCHCLPPSFSLSLYVWRDAEKYSAWLMSQNLSRIRSL